MRLHSKVWKVLTSIFIFINVAGGVWSASRGELVHTGVHAVLAIVGVYLAIRIWRFGNSVSVIGLPGELDYRIVQLEQSVDAIAIEIERVGEGQRFITQLLTEQGVPHKKQSS